MVKIPLIFGVSPSKSLGVDETGPDRLFGRVGLRVPFAFITLLFWFVLLCVSSGALLLSTAGADVGSTGALSSMIRNQQIFRCSYLFYSRVIFKGYPLVNPYNGALNRIEFPTSRHFHPIPDFN